MSFFNNRKLYALIKKNITLMKRNIILTIFEIVFPIIMFLLIIGIRKTFKIESYKFNEKEINTENYIRNKSIASINSYNYNYLGINIFPPFQICSKYNNQLKERPLIASIGIPEEIKWKMIQDSLIYKDAIKFSLNPNSFKEFSSIDEMEKYIKSPKYTKNLNGLICFGLQFSYDEINKIYNYSLHFFDTKFGNEGIKDIPNNKDGMFNKFQTFPDLNSFLVYQNGAYSYMIKIVNEYILRKELNDINAELNYIITPMRYTDYKLDSYEFIGFLTTIIIIVAYMAPLSLYIYRIVGEKETKIKETMKIMGLGELEYFFSYFIQYIIISLFVSLINSLLFKVVFKYIPFHFLFFSILLWAFDIFALVYFFQSFIDKKRIALILSLVIYFIMYCISLLCVFRERPLALKVILSIFPPVGLNIGILLLHKFEYHFRYFKNKDFVLYYNNYSIGIMYLMFIIDFFLYLFLGYYLDNILPHDFGIQRPWNFLFTKDYWNSFKKKNVTNNQNSINKDKKRNHTEEDLIFKNDDNLYGNSENFESEMKYKDKYNNNEIFKIRKIVKIFGDGKKAVDEVNLNLYKDEIFALLGQNGAGKTTLISILTGIYQATSGYAIYNDLNILNTINMNLFREKLGICPQHDILFDDLDVREHLEMFSIFKGVETTNIHKEIKKILQEFKLEGIQNMIAKNLSAGQRRKLSIALALIGGSEVIFLDEPSSGMDITSRKDLWEILKFQCKGKIIILTTHYMEEASVLGKRIGIINLGKMKCLGSPLFLIEKFGKYMNLNITKDINANDEMIIKYISDISPNIKYEILSEEILFRIQIKDNDEQNEQNEYKINLSNFFKKLDENLLILKIKSYNVSMPTLEDVFLNVSSNTYKKSIGQIRRELLIEENNNNILFNTNLKEKFSKTKKFINDFTINMKRRFLITIRDIKGFIMEMICPILILLIGLGISKSDMNYFSSPIRVDIQITGKQKIMFASLENRYAYNYLDNTNNITIETIEEFNDFNQNSKQKAIQYFVDLVYYKTRDYENSENNEIDMTTDDYIGYYSGFFLLEERDNKYGFIILLNTRVKHCIPIYCNYFLKKIIEKAINKKININFTHYPLPLTNDIKDMNNLGNKIIIIFFLGIAFSLQPIIFISLLVGERLNNSKHLMRISGINIFAYWLVNYIIDIVKNYFIGGICLVLLYLFKFYKKYLFIFYLIYGPAMISLTYSLSFLFSSESDAQNIIILIYFVFGDLGAIIICLLRGNNSVKNFAKTVEYILALNPLFCFNFAFDLLLNYFSIYIIDYPLEFSYFKENEIIKKFNLLLSMIIYLSIECILYTCLLIFLEIRTYSFPKTKINLLNEINIVNKKQIKIQESSRDDPINDIDKNKIYLINIKNLQKIYKSGCIKSNRKSIIAVKNLNFCLKPGECFGLLGFSGAGKTTTFKCITQELTQDKGIILVYGKDIRGKFNELNKIFGYCPQFNAIFEHLTVLENLEFYARIKDMNHNSIKTLIRTIIKEMSLNEFKYKISKNLSGGNKRKLSVAISILCNPPIILLDEPATGIDPEARRAMWSIIHRISTKGHSSVIMSTHSMDEAETLCKRIGIMINGEFACYGKPNEIREKYGKGYEIIIRIKPINEELQKIYLNNIDKNTLVNKDNLDNILKHLNKENFIGEFKEGKLGDKIYNYLLLNNNNIIIEELISFIFFVENALKFIEKGQKYFTKIILLENFENNFLFQIEKKDINSIGLIFSIFEDFKEECFVNEYSIHQTSLEQIFIKLANNKEEGQNEIIDKGITIDELLFNTILKKENQNESK